MRLQMLILLCCAAFLSGCASNGGNYISQLNERPLPKTAQDVQDECGWIRGEIARQQSIAQYGTSIATSPMMAMAYQAQARNNIAALETRAARLSCQAAFSQQAAPPASAGGNGRTMSFNQCFEKCMSLTDRTKDQCFDACK